LYVAKEAHRAAQVQLDVLLAGADANAIRAAHANVAAAVAQRDAAQAQLDELLAGATAEQIQAAEASVDQARVARDRVQLLLDQATLVASMDGVVTLIDVGVGELVNPGQEVVALSDLSILEVDMNLDEVDVARAVLGQEAVLTLDAFPGVELVGTVKYIAPKGTTAGGTVVFLVTVELAPVGLAVRSGMTADVEIVTAVQEDALIIPLRAVNVEDGRAYVTRLSGQSREQVDVVLGVATNTEIEILSGLSEGDEILAIARQSVDTEGQGFGAMRSLREN
ncbi:MAG: efflux RND transporter periplasmic adaptor subunit, partial [Anaerolineae bacterium]|nr:efflux RND transporter periplasmic adaptor subunit [Anaerolineae bacterium]